MTDPYGGNVLSSRAIYPSSRTAIYVGLLFASKFFRAFGLFLSYDLLKVIPVVQFLCIIKAGSAAPLLLLQKPFTSGKRLSKNQWFRIVRHAFVGSIINLLWMFGLTLCGPLRTILLFEHSNMVVVAWATALFTGAGGGPAKLRGAVLFLLAVITLLLFDHDDRHHLLSDRESDDLHTNFITRFFHHMFDLIGWSDHKGGVMLLFLTLCLQTGYENAAKKLCVDVGGSKRVHALSTLWSALMLLPWAVVINMTRESDIESWWFLLFPLLLVIFFVFILDYYIEAVAMNHLEAMKTGIYGSFVIFLSALFLGLTWSHPYVSEVTTLNKLQEITREEHKLSGGVVFSLSAFMVATYILTSPSQGSKVNFIGYSPAGLPLYSITGESLQKTSHTIMSVLKSGLRQILEESNSRKIFYFLCINLIFTFVELVYGVWTNSLGLISDGFHMLFDCSALVMGLYAAVMSRWKATRIFSFGFDRVEVLSGFVNGLFLVVIGLFVFTEATARLFEPPEIKTDRLLTVSVLGLLVNLVGIFVFHGSHGHGHSHGGQDHHSQSHTFRVHTGHPHSHSHHQHSHQQEHHSHRNSNMQGVFLHVLADTMGSVGVIVSSVLIENFGWNIADPICSIFIATMILLSVLPLLKETAFIMLLRSPVEMEKDFYDGLQRVLSVDGVLTYRDPQFWSHTASKVMGSLHVQVIPEASEQKIISQVTNIFKDIGVHFMTVQVEKEAYFHHLAGLSAAFDQMIQQTKSFGKFHVDKSNEQIIINTI